MSTGPYIGKTEIEKTALVTDIQRFCVNDGPGIRTNVYLKGCPLKCAWCHNPETISYASDIYWKRRLCIQCGNCVGACPQKAISLPENSSSCQGVEENYHQIDRKKCNACGKCIEVCKFGALQFAGKRMSLGQILFEVNKDIPFYNNSGGGLTISGGEPTSQPDFVRELLQMSSEMGIHTCLDTNGFCNWYEFESMALQADMVLYDFKHIDPNMHWKMTGVNNSLILENLCKLAQVHSRIWIRVPVIPGFNDQLQTHRQMAGFIKNLSKAIERVDLLPFHNWCEDKYSWLGIDWKLAKLDALDPNYLEMHRKVYLDMGIFATIGGSGFENPKMAQMG